MAASGERPPPTPRWSSDNPFYVIGGKGRAKLPRGGGPARREPFPPDTSFAFSYIKGGDYPTSSVPSPLGTINGSRLDFERAAGLFFAGLVSSGTLRKSPAAEISYLHVIKREAQNRPWDLSGTPRSTGKDNILNL